jgi:hypothetical protein
MRTYITNVVVVIIIIIVYLAYVDQFDLYFKISGTPVNEYCSTLKTRRCLRDDPIMTMHAAIEKQNFV